jgi:uncharacterized protein (TIGR03663 family)
MQPTPSPALAASEPATAARPAARRRWLAGFTLALLTLAALAVRLPLLTERPLHADESVHTEKFRLLWQTGDYAYDYREFHGPIHYYAALPVVLLSGAKDYAQTTEAQYRLVTVLFGTAMVGLLGLFWDGLGWAAVLVAAVLLTLSSPFIFYSRYYIQETPLACCTLAALGCGWRYAVTRHRGWLLACGAAFGLAIASKETAPLALLAAGAAGFVVWATRRRPADRPANEATPGVPARDLVLAVLVAAVVASLLLSGFGRHPLAPFDYLRSYTPWLRQAATPELHEQPWYYYLQLLTWGRRSGPPFTEGVTVVLAAVGLLFALFAPRRISPATSPALARFLGVYTLVLTVAYSAVPYKTPWIVLTFHTGWILLAGLAAVALVRLMPGKLLKALMVLLIAAGIGYLGWTSWQVNYKYGSMGRVPWAHSPTSWDAASLGEQVDGLLAVSPQGRDTVIQVIGEDDYVWPIPWYLRRANPDRIGYYAGALPDDLVAPIVIGSAKLEEALSQRLSKTHEMSGYFGLRKGVQFQVWVAKPLWAAYLAKQTAAEE